ncbi:DUF6263 family protein [Paludisphaera rhizosphaerae]|uniref:DUF6263 family protein n=1 Tax=Paludisphaera rhizosphaerae TaxID=2711216 RepID=UPI0013EBAC1F|nr:DUF6263 family protein [Paludisphaera rhizosphaerae]
MSHPSPTPRRRALATALGLAAILATAPAALADAPLRWKFTKGETIRYTLVQKTDTRMKAGDKEAGQTIQQASDVRWTVDDVSPEGVAQMTQANERIKIKMEVAGQPPFEFDSAEPDKAQEGPIAAQLSSMFKAVAGLQYTFKMDPRGRIDSVSIPQKSLDSLKQSFTGPMATLFSEESVKKMITQSILIFPEEAIADGKGWSEESKLPLAQFATVVTDKTYTVVGPEANAPGRVKIALDAKMKLEDLQNPQLQVEIKEQKSDGSYAFDKEKGRLDSSHVKIKMVQLITVGGNQLEQTIENTMDMTIGNEPAPK